MNKDAPVPSDAQKKLDAFLEICKSGKPIYIMTHDHPDPDAMTSAAGIQHLIKNRLNLKSRIVFGGLVERPENQAMKSYIRTRFSSLPPKLFMRDITLILVDAQPGAGNHSMPEYFLPSAVLDHHPLRRETKKCVFFDVRPDIGACATMVAEYLKTAEVAIPKTLATSFCYAIVSETRDLGREASEQDVETYLELLKLSNLRKLSRIEHSRVPKDYFLTLHSAVENAFVYREIIGSCLGRVSRPDLAAQIADLLLTLERMQWSICSAAFKDRLYVSIRTTRLNERCPAIMQKILGKEGSAGGHGMIAGGYHPIAANMGEEELKALERGIMLRFVRHLEPPGLEKLPPLRSSNGAKNTPADPGQASQ
ncbi:MAG: DHH family phosphoesterase [Planctomycetes bacterium]|nr:DHH family phosphoesterase [Planctomycetota bacterium]